VATPSPNNQEKIVPANTKNIMIPVNKPINEPKNIISCRMPIIKFLPSFINSSLFDLLKYRKIKIGDKRPISKRVILKLVFVLIPNVAGNKDKKTTSPTQLKPTSAHNVSFKNSFKDFRINLEPFTKIVSIKIIFAFFFNKDFIKLFY